MRRDMDLVRAILLKMEATTAEQKQSAFDIPGYSREQVAYHLCIMAEGGLIKTVDVSDTGSQFPLIMPASLAWEGHEFADASRSDSPWDEAKNVIDKVGSAPYTIWMKVLELILIADNNDQAGDGRTGGQTGDQGTPNQDTTGGQVAGEGGQDHAQQT